MDLGFAVVESGEDWGDNDATQNGQIQKDQTVTKDGLTATSTTDGGASGGVQQMEVLYSSTGGGAPGVQQSSDGISTKGPSDSAINSATVTPDTNQNVNNLGQNVMVGSDGVSKPVTDTSNSNSSVSTAATVQNGNGMQGEVINSNMGMSDNSSQDINNQNGGPGQQQQQQIQQQQNGNMTLNNNNNHNVNMNGPPGQGGPGFGVQGASGASAPGVVAGPPVPLVGGGGNNNSSRPPGRMHVDSRTRYFIIKCNSHKNLVSSIQCNVWATQRHNEKKLNEALRVAPYVVLLFSVNMSGSFQGYARMTGMCGHSQREDPFCGFGALFDVKWLKLHDLDFSQSELVHLTNPWNNNLSIKISRDGQELPNALGRQICELIDDGVYMADPSSFVADEEEANIVPPDAPPADVPLFPESAQGSHGHGGGGGHKGHHGGGGGGHWGKGGHHHGGGGGYRNNNNFNGGFNGGNSGGNNSGYGSNNSNNNNSNGTSGSGGFAPGMTSINSSSQSGNTYSGQAGAAPGFGGPGGGSTSSNPPGHYYGEPPKYNRGGGGSGGGGISSGGGGISSSSGGGGGGYRGGPYGHQ